APARHRASVAACRAAPGAPPGPRGHWRGVISILRGSRSRSSSFRYAWCDVQVDAGLAVVIERVDDAEAREIDEPALRHPPLLTVRPCRAPDLGDVAD